MTGLAGWFAEMFMKSGTGILVNILLGIVGASLANWLLDLLGIALGGWIGWISDDPFLRRNSKKSGTELRVLFHARKPHGARVISVAQFT